MDRNSASRWVRCASVALDGRSDAELLAKFAAERDEAAFAVLVRRHGPLVLGVCRRALGNDADAEDAFQAVFCVLASKAGALRWHESIRGWLYAVSSRIARDARNRRELRIRREWQVGRRVCEMPSDSDFRTALDEELSLLPPKYRDVVIACCLDGKSRDETAGELGVPAGTIKIRLERGRNLLRKRLAARGIEPAVALAAAAVAADSLAGSVVGNTARVAAAWAGGAVEIVPVESAILAKGATRTMLAQKLRSVILLLAVGTVGIIGWGIAFGPPAVPLEPLPPAAALAPIPEPRVKPGQKAVSKPDQFGVVTALRPFVSRLAPGDPVRVALHFEGEAGPFAEKVLPNGDPIPSAIRRAIADSLTFRLATPGGKTYVLQGQVTSTAQGAEVASPLSRLAGWYLTLKDDGAVEESVGWGLRATDDGWQGDGYYWSKWKDDARVDLSAPGRYSLRMSGKIPPAAPGRAAIPFESEPIEFERLRAGSTTFDDLDAVARTGLPEGAKLDETKVLLAPLVVEDADGNRTVRYRGTEVKGFDTVHYHYEVVIDRTGKKVVSATTHRVNTCIARGTLLDGERGPIRVEHVRVGDRIWGHAPGLRQRVLTVVRHVSQDVAGRTLAFGKLRITGNHPVFAGGQWKRADAVRPYDEFVGSNGKRVLAGVPRQLTEAIDVYDLAVDSPHTYFAGGILVHNKQRVYTYSPASTAYYQLWPEELPKAK